MRMGGEAPPVKRLRVSTTLRSHQYDADRESEQHTTNERTQSVSWWVRLGRGGAPDVRPFSPRACRAGCEGSHGGAFARRLIWYQPLLTCNSLRTGALSADRHPNSNLIGEIRYNGPNNSRHAQVANGDKSSLGNALGLLLQVAAGRARTTSLAKGGARIFSSPNWLEHRCAYHAGVVYQLAMRHSRRSPPRRTVSLERRCIERSNALRVRLSPESKASGNPLFAAPMAKKRRVVTAS
jgi:hypothetical protein